MKRKVYSILFISILFAFIAAPTVQQYLTDEIVIVNINEIPEEENKKNVVEEKHFAKHFSKLSTIFGLLSQSSLYQRLHQFSFYESPVLKLPTPPPKVV